ncbi:MAG: phosphoglucomutase [Bacteroidales bacterium]|nr:phosphoglucomutase [Bacteroidales bacterium]
MKDNINFGTDGWRGLIGEEVNTVNIRRIAQAFADFLIMNNKNKKVVIGYDGRLYSRRFARNVAEVLNGNGIWVLLSESKVPTPVVSFISRTQNCGAGIMITASHNPPEYNGVKFKTSDGSPFSAEETAMVETLLDKNKVRTKSRDIETVNLLYSYMGHLDKLIDFDAIEKAGLSVAIDSMAGAGRTILGNLLLMKGVTVKTIYGQATTNFSGRRPEPIRENLQPLAELLQHKTFALGLATDGDADRLGVLTNTGEWLNIQEAILYLAQYYTKEKKTRGPIVKTASVSDKLLNIKRSKKQQVIDVQVGFKYVAEAMMKSNAAFGAEESGGFGFKEHIPDRDGLFAALVFLEMLAKSGEKNLDDFISKKRKKYGRIHYDRVDVPYDVPNKYDIISKLAENTPEEICKYKVAGTLIFKNNRNKINGIKFRLEGSPRWLLLRVSETEPLVRVYAEGEGPDEVKQLLTAGKELMCH